MNNFVFNISFDFATLTLAILGIIFILIVRNINNKWDYFFSIFVTIFLEVLCNLLGVLYKGDTSSFGKIIIPIVIFGEYLFVCTLSILLTLYLIKCIENDNFILHGKYFFLIPHMIHIIIIIINLFVPIYYYIDSNNVYHRADLFYLSEIFALLFLLIDIILYIYYFKKLDKVNRYAFLFYFIFLIIGVVLQFFYYGIYFLLIASSLSAALMFVIVFANHVSLYMKNQRELSNLKMQVMISQIQPHFIFNTLTAIESMCQDKAPEAQKTLNSFAKYLRVNFEALGTNKLIPFAKELDHIKRYVDIEKIRFGERLNVEYNIQTMNFKIPVLSIQPLIENAIKHGILKKEDGGLVILSTYEDKKNYYIIIEDNGIGFNYDRYNEDGKTHIGLKNAKIRFETYCKAHMKIESKIGEGTKILINIPKGEK